MNTPPTTQQQADEIASAIARLPLLTNTMVSEDHQAIAIYIPLVSETVSYQLAEEIRVYVAQFDGDHQFYITGLPVAEDQFGSEMFVQIAICAPLAGAMIFFMMWLFFRNIPLIVAPMLVTIAVVDSIHIMSEFVDRYQRYKTDAASAIKQVVAHLFQPMFFTSITSAVGFSL
ncbi:MAG: MMPL family transporter [Gammaproteobacteria bacterium]|nr:MMPL family transporter [Gammaproteobacteria bacterium]